MSYHTTTYGEDIKLPLLDWLTNSGAGKNVTDLALSLANRAQRNLWAKKPWSNLTKKVEMTLSGNSYSFPADFGRIVEIFADLDGSGRPSYWFYQGYDLDGGYDLEDDFNKTDGHSWTITFHYSQQNPWLRYQKVLPNFAGDGTEYSFFPAGLMLLECQKINTLSKGDLKEYQANSIAFDEAFRDFCSATQWINGSTKPRINDRHGYEIYGSAYSLNGEGVSPYTELPNSYLP